MSATRKDYGTPPVIDGVRLQKRVLAASRYVWLTFCTRKNLYEAWLMWDSFVCRHFEVNWPDAFRCQCQNCGKYGHYFEADGYALWTKAARRPWNDEGDVEISKAS